MKVLDIWAGEGKDSIRFQKKGACVISIEISPKLFQYSSLTTVKVVGDAEVLPSKNSTFDVVFGRAILHHLPQIENCIQEAYRVLRRGGLFLTIEPLRSTPFVNLGRHWREKYDGRLREQKVFKHDELPKLIKNVFHNVNQRSFHSLLVLFQAMKILTQRYLKANVDPLQLYRIVEEIDFKITNTFPMFGQIQVCWARKMSEI